MFGSRTPLDFNDSNIHNTRKELVAGNVNYYEWMHPFKTAVSNLFYTDGNLTLIGVMSILGLGIGVFTLVVGIICSLTKVRG